METILLLETSTECCSAALCRGGRILASKEDSSPKVHASKLIPFCLEVLAEAALSIAELDAVAVSEGPGSYTGLRVGVSTAKGICFGASKPLISVDTLEILALQGCNHQCAPHKIVPFIDARRMEVYSAIFSGDERPLKTSPTEAVILEKDSFSELLSEGPVLFIGTGVTKFQEICNHPNAFFQECFPLAEFMTIPATEAVKKKEFKDVAYFEPFYLKEFVAGISKKSVL